MPRAATGLLHGSEPTFIGGRGNFDWFVHRAGGSQARAQKEWSTDGEEVKGTDREIILGAVVSLDTLGCGQADAGIVADALQDVGQEQVLRVEGNIQQEPGGGGSDEHPEVPAWRGTRSHRGPIRMCPVLVNVLLNRPAVALDIDCKTMLSECTRRCCMPDPWVSSSDLLSLADL